MESSALYRRAQCSFTDLPLEIRHQIYEDAIRASVDRKLKWHEPWFYGKIWCHNLASTCRQIRQEFLPLISKEIMLPLKSSTKLTALAKNGPPAMRAIVQNLPLTFHEADWDIFEKLSSPRPKASCESPPGLEYMVQERHKILIDKVGVRASCDFPESDSQDAWEKTAKVWNAAHCFPNVSMLWLHADCFESHFNDPPLTSDHERPMALILGILSHAFPDLQTLRLQMYLPPLFFLKELPKLRSLQFSGYSQTSQKDTLLILQSLKYLENIEIIQDSWGPFPERAILPTESHFQDLVMTPEIISQMNPLKSVTIKSISDCRVRIWQTIPLTRALMDAFLVHSQSLQSLEITQTFHCPSTENCLLEILEFAHSSPIPHIYLYLRLYLSSPLDRKYSLPPTCGKRIDIFLHEPALEVRTGKYFPSARELEWRRKKYDTALLTLRGMCPWYPDRHLDSNMEHSGCSSW